MSNANQSAVQKALEAIGQAQVSKNAENAWKNMDVKVAYSGRTITLPADPGQMPIPAAIDALQRLQKMEQQVVAVRETIDAFPTDAMVAFVRAMQKLYGWAEPVPKPGFFGPTPPIMITVKTGPGARDIIQVPFGRFNIPGVEAPIDTIVQPDNKGNWAFSIVGQVKSKDKAVIVELADETRKIVRAHSIYKGKAISVGVDLEGKMDWNNPPEFMDVSDTKESDLVFDEDVQSSISTNILAPIQHTEDCRKYKIPLKRGVLLEGPFGTGKTLTARMTAAVCERHNWTFIMLADVRGLKAALDFAKRYAPAVVFAEDIDRVATERDQLCNDLVNTMDGVMTKTTEIMVVLTTNFAEKLDPVILRPGRLDAVISLRPPSAGAAIRLVRHYAGNLLAPEADLTAAGEALAGQIPASLREAVERAKLGMVARGATTLVAEDLVMAAFTMKSHTELMARRMNTKEPTDAEKLADVLPRVLLNGRGQKIDLLPEIKKLVDDIYAEIS